MKWLVILYAFAIGVSFAATFVTLTYLSVGYSKIEKEKGEPPKISQSLLDILARFAYGIANVLVVLLGNSVWAAAVVGAGLGELLSLVGRFKFDLPKKLFGIKDKNAWLTHIFAPILYALVFVVLIRNLNLRLLRLPWLSA